MTNHVHTIMQSSNGNLSDLVRDFKKFTSKQILYTIQANSIESRKDWLQMIFKYYAKFNRRAEEVQFWTHHNHAVELTSNEMNSTRLNYIHQNPVSHGFIKKCAAWKYSSYNAILNDKSSRVDKESVLNWFDNVGNFIACHNEKTIKNYALKMELEY